MVSARSHLIARADSYLPADARPTRKLEAPRTTIGGTAIGESATARKNLVRRDYDPLAELIAMRPSACCRIKFNKIFAKVKSASCEGVISVVVGEK